MARTRLYRNGRLEAEDFPVADVSDHLQEPDAVVWFDLCSPTEEDLGSIREELGFHELAVEDALQAKNRPKLDVYETHLFLSLYTTYFDTGSGRLETCEASAFVTKNALVTVRSSDRFEIEEVVERWDTTSGIAHQGVGFLLHGLLDYVVDSQFDAIELIDDQVEGLEETLFDERPLSPTDQRRTFEIRKSLVTLRRIVLPMREVINPLLRHDDMLGDGQLAPYFQDVYDHALRAIEWTDSLRELLNNIREAHLTMQSNRMNLIMKRVTSWAAIIAVPTLITGFFGQNIPFPSSEQTIGVWVSSALILATSATLYWIFRRRDWL
jgi:magnesium transporter